MKKTPTFKGVVRDFSVFSFVFVRNQHLNIFQHFVTSSQSLVKFAKLTFRLCNFLEIPLFAEAPKLEVKHNSFNMTWKQRDVPFSSRRIEKQAECAENLFFNRLKIY